MPRIKQVSGEPARRKPTKLAHSLAVELKADRDHGQPIIAEEVYTTGLIRVNVLWDRWNEVPFEDRSATILQAYRIAEDPQAEQVTLASGLTFPEAVNSAMLPYQILPALRPGDPVTVEECRAAMIEEGASLLIDSENPPLLFGTEAQAQAARQRLTERLPGSEPVWLINRQVGNSLDLSWDDEV